MRRQFSEQRHGIRDLATFRVDDVEKLCRRTEIHVDSPVPVHRLEVIDGALNPLCLHASR
jgi:hypothetical protein